MNIFGVKKTQKCDYPRTKNCHIRKIHLETSFPNILKIGVSIRRKFNDVILDISFFVDLMRLNVPILAKVVYI
jgi:hypothetical protein